MCPNSCFFSKCSVSVVFLFTTTYSISVIKINHSMPTFSSQWQSLKPLTLYKDRMEVLKVKTESLQFKHLTPNLGTKSTAHVSTSNTCIFVIFHCFKTKPANSRQDSRCALISDSTWIKKREKKFHSFYFVVNLVTVFQLHIPRCVKSYDYLWLMTIKE